MMIKTVHSSGDGEVGGGGGGNCMMLLVLLLLLFLHQLFLEHNNNSNRKPNFLFVVITFSSLVLFLHFIAATTQLRHNSRNSNDAITIV